MSAYAKYFSVNVKKLAISFFTFLMAASMVAQLALAEPPAPPLYGIEVVEYEREITQAPGTSAVYDVTVRNSGVFDLDPIYATISRAPEEWFTSTTIGLKFDETGRLQYILDLPSDASGVHVFALNVYGEYADMTAVDTEPVILTIGSGGTTTSTTVPSEVEVGEGIDISEEIPGGKEEVTTTTVPSEVEVGEGIDISEGTPGEGTPLGTTTTVLKPLNISEISDAFGDMYSIAEENATYIIIGVLIIVVAAYIWMWAEERGKKKPENKPEKKD